jgi:hypothetical protein
VDPAGQDLERAGESPEGDPRPWELLGVVRRNAEPHRGPLLDRLGLTVALCGFLAVLVLPGLVALPLGLWVWSLAATDLQKMRAGLMDPDGRERTESARNGAIMGIILTLMWGCYGLAYLLRNWLTFGL